MKKPNDTDRAPVDAVVMPRQPERDDLYETGEVPEAGDVVECLPGNGAYHPGHELQEGEQYTVCEVDGGYVFFSDDYGWWPTRFALVSRAESASA